jgi:antimicrobial peptide system SdpA family protein
LTFFAPQGWVFFTRSPREANDRVYGRTSPCCELLTLPNGAAANLFGLKRDARSFGIEMAPLLTAIRRDAWLECRDSLADCVSRLKVPPATVANASATRMACGQIVIQRQQPIPWAWSGNRNIRPPYALASLNVSCK